MIYNMVSQGGATPTGTKTINITANGTTTEDVTNYANAQVVANVPNTYSAGDEGKVVSSGALVSQTSATYTTNNTYDTTLVNSVTVNVSGGGGGWQRPAAWPDYDSLNLSTSQVESWYLTYDNRISGAWIGICCEGAYTVQRVSISGGVVTVISSENRGSGVAFGEVIPSDAGDYVSYRVIPQGGAHLTKISMSTLSGQNNGNGYTRQPCVERYGYLPNVATFGYGYAYRNWASDTLRSDTLLGIPNNLYIDYSTLFSLENLNIDASSIRVKAFTSCGLVNADWSKIKVDPAGSLANYVTSSCLEEVDLSGSTITSAVTNIGSIASNAYMLKKFKFPAGDYSGITSTGSAFSGSRRLEVIDLPASLTCQLGVNFAASCSALRALVIRASSVVPIANATNVLPVNLLQKGGARVYVKSSLINTYKTETNWATYYASYPDMFGAIEGSEFE